KGVTEPSVGFFDLFWMPLNFFKYPKHVILCQMGAILLEPLDNAIGQIFVVLCRKRRCSGQDRNEEPLHHRFDKDQNDCDRRYGSLTRRFPKVSEDYANQKCYDH